MYDQKNSSRLELSIARSSERCKGMSDRLRLCGMAVIMDVDIVHGIEEAYKFVLVKLTIIFLRD